MGILLSILGVATLLAIIGRASIEKLNISDEEDQNKETSSDNS